MEKQNKKSSRLVSIFEEEERLDKMEAILESITALAALRSGAIVFATISGNLYVSDAHSRSTV